MRSPFLLLFLLQTSLSMLAQNYDESKIPRYSLPDILLSESGQLTETVDAWEKVRRGEVLELFRDQMYGKVPEFEYTKDYQHRILKHAEFKDGATQEEVTITIANDRGEIKITLLLTLPKNTKGPVFPFSLG